MPLRTVQVPEEMAPLFERAEELVSAYFAKLRRDPEHGTIDIDGERYVLVRAASLSVEFFSAIERMFGRIKDFRRIATRYDKLARNFLAAVCLVATVC